LNTRFGARDKIFHEHFIIQDRPAPGAFPILFCKPSDGLMEYLTTTHALKVVKKGIKRSATMEGFCRNLTRWIDIFHGLVCVESNRKHKRKSRKR
jgi:hypothetical protein